MGFVFFFFFSFFFGSSSSSWNPPFYAIISIFSGVIELLFLPLCCVQGVVLVHCRSQFSCNVPLQAGVALPLENSFSALNLNRGEFLGK